MDQGQTRLWVDGVGSPITSKVTRSDGARCTIEQALPFLQLDNEVRDEARRRGRIEWVGLEYDGGTPRLVVDLVYDEDVDQDDPTVAGLDDTIPVPTHAAQLEPAPEPARERSRRREDETVPFVTEGARVSREIVISDAPPPPPTPPLAPPAGSGIGARIVWWLTQFGQTAERVAQELAARLRPAPA